MTTQPRINDQGLCCTDVLAPMGTTVLRESPLVHVTTHSKNGCNGCLMHKGDRAGLWYVCARCKQFAYCSKTCQSEDWRRFHKYECRTMMNRDGLVKDKWSRLFIRMFILRDHHPNDYQTMMALPHTKDMRTPDKIERLAYAIMFMGDTFTEWTVLYQAFVDISALHVVRAESYLTDDSYGLAIYNKGSYVLHSCQPNSVVIRDGNNLHIKVLSASALPVGGVISISYVPLGLSTTTRRAILNRDYGFNCTCVRCMDPTDSVDALLNARTPGLQQTGWLNEIIDAQMALIRQSSSMPIAVLLSKCQDIVRRLDRCVGPYSYHRIRVLKTLAILGVEKDQWTYARKYLPIYIAWEEAILPTNHPYIMVHKFLLAKVLASEEPLVAKALLAEIALFVMLFWVADSPFVHDVMALASVLTALE